MLAEKPELFSNTSLALPLLAEEDVRGEVGRAEWAGKGQNGVGRLWKGVDLVQLVLIRSFPLSFL